MLHINSLLLGATIVLFALIPQLAFAGGTRCSAGDGDPIKCMACAVYMEARGGGESAMIAVGRNIKTRYQSGKYPKSICAIVHQKGQYAPGVRNGYIREAGSWAKAMSAARKAMKMRGNGYLGFRTCTAKSKGRNVGGNCFQKTAELFDSDGAARPGTYQSGPAPGEDSGHRAPASEYAEAEDSTPIA